MPSFDLLTQRWLNCAMLDGTSQALGVLDILAKAHEIKEIAEPSPLDTFAAYRFLIAIVHWLDPIQSVDDWRARWDADRFSDSLLQALQARGRDDRQRLFDLFDPARPFYQHMAPADATDREDVGKLAIDVPTATEINHFCHAYDGDNAFCPACCAKGLLTLCPFATQGGGGHYASINGKPPLYLLPVGHSVHQTLLLNLPVAELGTIWGVAPTSDTPAWERTPTTPREGTIGILEGLTWQPRRALLVPRDAGRCTYCGREEPVVVAEMFYPTHGDSRGSGEKRRGWNDPHAAQDPESGEILTPANPAANPECWIPEMRSIALADTDRGTPVLRQLAALSHSKALPAQWRARVQLIAVQSKQASVTRWGRVEVVYPPAALADESVGSLVRGVLAYTEALANEFWRALVKDHSGREETKRAKLEARSSLAEFHACARHAFRETLAQLAGDPSGAEAQVGNLKAKLRDLAEGTLRLFRRPRPTESRWRGQGATCAEVWRRWDRAARRKERRNA